MKIFVCVLLTALASLFTIKTYTSGPLNGSFDKYLMQADRWGIPDELKKKGIEPLYRDSANAGWDGQFYYYIANDLLAKKDTPQHIDADAYRYQRIGIPVLSKLISIILFQDWVSPLVYYVTQFGLILLGTFVAARLFGQAGISPYWIIPWAVGLGTQITLLNGLPDGAADGLLIVALISCYQRRYLLYSLAATFACLSREVYVLFPAIFLAVQWFSRRIHKSDRGPLADYVYLTFPLLVFAAWQIFIRLRFAHAPSEQSASVLGLPLLRIYDLFIAGINGQYPGLPGGSASYIAGIGIFLFVVLMMLMVSFAMRIPFLASLRNNNIFALSLKLFVLSLCALYFCFGDTVMWNFTGYMKAANIFIFLIPFIVALGYGHLSKWLAIVIVTITIFFCWQGLDLRVFQPPIKYKLDSNCGHTFFKGDKSCQEKFVWRGDELPGIVGGPRDSFRVADERRDQPGFLTFGPYVEMPKGRYRVLLLYAANGNNAGYLDIVGRLPDGKEITFRKIQLPDETNGTIGEVLDIPQKLIKTLEVRVWFQRGSLVVHSLTIEHLPEK